METPTKTDVIGEALSGVPEINRRKKDSRTIRNVHTRGTTSWFSDQLDADRESAIVQLCKFMTGKRKRSAVAALGALSNPELLIKAWECEYTEKS